MSAGAENTQAHPAPDRPTTSPEASAPAAARWLARAAFLAALAAAVVLVGFALNGGVGLLLAAALGVVLVVGSAWWFLSVRGAFRWLALALVVLTPVVLAWLFIRDGLLWVPLVVLVLLAAAAAAGQAALLREARRAACRSTPRPPRGTRSS